MKTPNALNLKNRYLKSLQVSWKEGVAAAIMLNITDYYLIPLGLILGATTFHIGLQVAVPQLVGSIAQLLSVGLVTLLGSRLRFLVHGVTLQAALLIPVALLPVFNIPHRIEIFIGCIIFFRVIGNLIGTVWGSLVSDYLPAEERGKYLGWRSQIAGISGVLGMIIGGIILSVFRPISAPIGFLIVMFIAATARAVSAFLMAKMEDLPLAHKEDSDFTFWQFVSRFKESNFVQFVLYVSCITFATNMAAPYFSVYMIQDLKLNYFLYMSVHLAAVIAGLVAFPIWGRHADTVGNAKILKLASFFIPLIPLLWLFTKNPILLIIIEVFAGFVWGGFNLCCINFIFDAVTPEKRVRCLSYFHFINGLAIFSGALLGGFLAPHLPKIQGSSLCTLFLFSGIVRFFAHFLLSKNFREVRSSAQPVSSKDLFFSVIGIRSLFERNQE